MSVSTDKPDWSLTPGAFDQFLTRLDGDRNRAGEKYEQLRRRLIGFFEWRGSSRPEEHADLTINRMIKRLEHGEDVLHVEAYAVGVARLVLLEARRERERERRLQHTRLEPWPAPPEQEARGRCLESCLEALAEPERELILAYYGDEGAGRIGARRALAARFGVAPEALRARAFRIREKLDACVRRCLARSGRPREEPDRRW